MTVVARTTRDVLTVAGPEAVTWLQGQLSQDVAAIAPGESRWTFILAPQGKVDGWGRLHRLGHEELQIDVDAGAGPAWVARLERFKLRTKAQIDLTADVDTVAVRGATPPGGLPAGWPGIQGTDYLDADHEVTDALVAEGAALIDEDAFEALAIRAGIPAWGAEIGTDTIPATLGQWVIEASVSFTKGCFTGQELVARIDSRGGNVPRRLVGLAIDGPPPAPGTDVTGDGTSFGTVTRSAPDADTGGSVALVFAPRSIDVPGSAIVGDRPAELLELPMRLGPAPTDGQ